MVRLSWTTVMGGLWLLASAFFMLHTFDAAYAVSHLTAGRGPVFYPRILLALLIVLSVAVMIAGLREKSAGIDGPAAGNVLAVMALNGLYILGILTAGFLISTVVFTLLLPLVLGYRNLWMVLALTAVAPVAVWYVFSNVFGIILPASPWFDSF